MKVSAAIDITLALLIQAQRISSIVQVAQEAGRSELTPEEFAAIQSDDNTARATLVTSIARAKLEGR